MINCHVYPGIGLHVGYLYSEDLIQGGQLVVFFVLQILMEQEKQVSNYVSNFNC